MAEAPGSNPPPCHYFFQQSRVPTPLGYCMNITGQPHVPTAVKRLNMLEKFHSGEFLRYLF